MPYIGTCFRFYTQMRVQKKTKHLHVEFIVTSHNSASTFARVNKYHSGPHGDSKVLSKENGPQIFRGNGLRELTFFLIPLKLLRCRIQSYWYRVQLETVRLFFGTVI